MKLPLPRACHNHRGSCPDLRVVNMHTVCLELVCVCVCDMLCVWYLHVSAQVYIPMLGRMDRLGRLGTIPWETCICFTSGSQ